MFAPNKFEFIQNLACLYMCGCILLEGVSVFICISVQGCICEGDFTYILLVPVSVYVLRVITCACSSRYACVCGPGTLLLSGAYMIYKRRVCMVGKGAPTTMNRLCRERVMR